VQRLAETRQLALTDELTGLGNRRLFLRSLQHELSVTEREDRPRLAVLMVDLDRFKEVNDAFGHPVGDELLGQLGPRLRQTLRSTDVLARLGGDEFAVLLRHADSDYAIDVARRMSDVLRQPFALRQVSVHVGASVGIALAPEHGTDTDELLRCADVAMYRAKAGHTAVAVYDSSADTSRERLRLVEDLRDAIDNGSLTLHYQPQVDLRTGSVPSVEALLRWTHPERGAISPVEFIPLAEEARLMRPLTRLVLDRALGQCAQWLRRGTPVAVGVNLSATNLLDGDLPEQVQELLTIHGLPSALLILEITESTLMADPVLAHQVVCRLHALGVSIAVDDFGTGFSSLAYLRELPVDQLKLDRTFVAGLGKTASGRDTAIASSALSLGHALGMSVVAEGVEEPATLATLSDLGFDVAQGFYLGHPVPPDALHLGGRKELLAAEGASERIG
jgi:diguanylate cyclase (GGDEF)-like protein